MTNKTKAAIKASLLMIAFLGFMLVIWNNSLDPQFMKGLLAVAIVAMIGALWTYFYLLFRMKNP
jgi:uncharacterized membrane-anchored protein YjiN (DUF445 family)